MFQIGRFIIQQKAVLAPMAGITDLPFRRLCLKLGAGLTVSEMVTSQQHLWHSQKTQNRLQFSRDIFPNSVQILGNDPQIMAKAAQYNVQLGADIIDINMGCPAKKVCHTEAGSALMRDPALVDAILSAVVSSVDVPVTLKIRSGWDKQHKNALEIAKIAEQNGIQAIAVHGRTRACHYREQAEYEVIAEIKQQISIPVIANGDIDSVEKAAFVLQYTGADAIMIGRQAQLSPWIFKQINHYLKAGGRLAEPEPLQKRDWLIELVQGCHQLYGESHGVRVARKHIKAFLFPLHGGREFWQQLAKVQLADLQIHEVNEFFRQLSYAKKRKETKETKEQK